ncbi:hypothetical protein Q9966_008018 [Columba livia]|nr:hypothetical protein Q9966_008018 [Columba livia]
MMVTLCLLALWDELGFFASPEVILFMFSHQETCHKKPSIILGDVHLLGVHLPFGTGWKKHISLVNAIAEGIKCLSALPETALYDCFFRHEDIKVLLSSCYKQGCGWLRSWALTRNNQGFSIDGLMLQLTPDRLLPRQHKSGCNVLLTYYLDFRNEPYGYHWRKVTCNNPVHTPAQPPDVRPTLVDTEPKSNLSPHVKLHFSLETSIAVVKQQTLTFDEQELMAAIVIKADRLLLEGPGKVLKNPPNDQSDHQAENRMEWRNSDHLRRNVKELNGR